MSLELRPNEYVKIEVHFSYKVFVFPMLLMSIGILMFLAVWTGAVGSVTIHWMGQIIKLSSLLLLVGIALFIPYIYKRLDNRLKIYAVTNQRVYIRRGIININEKDIPLAKINDVQITQNLSQRMFAAGNVVIQVGNDKSRICIEDVNYPRDFRDTVISAIYDLQQEEEIRQREFQQQQYGYNQGGFPPNGYNQGYPPAGGYNQGYNNPNGYNQGGYGAPNNYGGGYGNQNGYNQGGYNQGGYGSDDYGNNGGYNPSNY